MPRPARTLVGYKQFLALKVLNDDFDATKLSPSLPIDMMWHSHVLDRVDI